MIYSQRLGTVEPPFDNLHYHKHLDRFTLRGREKIDAQWKLFALVHNIEKLAHYRRQRAQGRSNDHDSRSRNGAS